MKTPIATKVEVTHRFHYPAHDELVTRVHVEASRDVPVSNIVAVAESAVEGWATSTSNLCVVNGRLWLFEIESTKEF